MAEDRGPVRLSGCGAFNRAAHHPLRWVDVGVDAALGPDAVEPAGVGVAVSERLMLARRAGQPASAQDQSGVGATDDAAGAPLAP
jgi:hypothetical protein